MDPKKVAQEKKEVALLPITEALPKYRKWAEQDRGAEAPGRGASRSSRGRRIRPGSRSSSRASPRSITPCAAPPRRRSSSTARRRPTARSRRCSRRSRKSTEADRPQIAWALAALHEGSAFDDVMKRVPRRQALERAAPRQEPGVRSRAARRRWSRSTSSRRSPGDESESVRQLVATVLSRNAEPKYTQTLIKLVQDKSVEVAREAAVGLGKIANEEAMQPLLEALAKADKDSRQKFLEALRDGVGGKGLVLALRSVDKSKRDDGEVPDQAHLRHAPDARGSARRRPPRAVHRDEPAPALEDRGRRSASPRSATSAPCPRSRGA